MIMKILLFLLFSVFALNEAKLSGFIVGGDNAPTNSEFTVRIVSILDEQGYLFSGVACTAHRVLTVAQAVYGYNRWIVGSGHLSTSDLFNQNAVAAYHHPDFNPDNLANNIGVLYVDIEISRFLGNIVPFNPLTIPFFAVFGFGIDATGNTTGQLQMKLFSSVQESLCRLEHNPVVFRDDNFCGTVGDSDGYLDGGDQGGPVTNALRTQLFGIISYWPSDWNVNEPQPSSVFVELNYHREFITNHTEVNLF